MQTGALSILRMIALPRLILLCLALVACDAIAAGAGQSARDTTTTATAPTPPWVASARKQVGVTLIYDPAYVRLPYPGGDVPQERGVCTDVVIRALRPQGLDLQKAVHEDMRAHFRLYPKNWGLRAPDRYIDHRQSADLVRTSGLVAAADARSVELPPRRSRHLDAARQSAAHRHRQRSQIRHRHAADHPQHRPRHARGEHPLRLSDHRALPAEVAVIRTLNPPIEPAH
jgi:hypothetical protein